jgi:hypothetical protein
MPSGFGLADAMTSLYGNYDSAAGFSLYDPSSEDPWNMITAGIISDTSAYSPPSEKLDMRVFFAAAVPDSSNREVLLATFGIPRSGNFDCHACAPYIGAALFKQGRSGWMRQASVPPFLQNGSFGQHPEARLLQFGPHRYGIELEERNMHQGDFGTTITLFLPWNGRFINAFSTATIGSTMDDEHSACRSEDEPDTWHLPLCYSFHRELKFMPGRNSQYYDLVVTTFGTGANEFGKVVDISGTMRLRFVDGKYRGD